MRVAIWIGLTFNFLIYGPGIAVATYYEAPRVGETWLDTLDGRNMAPLSWWQAQSALVVALDIYIFVLPLPSLMRLQLPTRKRTSVIAVFSVALMWVSSISLHPSLGKTFCAGILTSYCCRGIAASIASLVERINIVNTDDTTWISAILCLCR